MTLASISPNVHAEDVSRKLYVLSLELLEGCKVIRVRTAPGAKPIGRSLLAKLSGAVTYAAATSGRDKIKFPAGVGTKALETTMRRLANKKGFLEEVGLEGRRAHGPLRDHDSGEIDRHGVPASGD